MKFSERFRILREERGLTQRDFTKSFNDRFDLKISYPTISYWETGREPNFDILTKLAEYFSCTVDYLLGTSDFKTERDKIQYFHTEQVLHENLNQLSENDKSYLVHSINHILTMYDKVKNYRNENNVKLLSDMIKYVALMIQCINFELVRFEESDYVSKDYIHKRTFETNSNTILQLIACKEKASITLDEIYRDLLLCYTKILNENVSKGVTNNSLHDWKTINPLSKPY